MEVGDVDGWLAAGARRLCCTLALAFAALVAPACAAAHHSFAAFDTSTDKIVKGVVEQVQYANPHAWLFLKAQSGDAYLFACDGVANLVRQNWLKDSVKPDDAVEIAYHPFIDKAKKGGMLIALRTRDGKEYRHTARLSPK